MSHVQVQGGCPFEALEFLQHVLDLGNWEQTSFHVFVDCLVVGQKSKGFEIVKAGDAHSEVFAFLSTLAFTSLSTSSLIFFSCDSATGCGCACAGLHFGSFNPKHGPSAIHVTHLDHNVT